MEKLKEIDIEIKFGYAIIKGEYYEWSSKSGKPYLKLVDKQKVEKKIEMTKKIADKLKDNLDAHKVLTESIVKLPSSDLKKLYHMLFEVKKKYKVITREHHCVDMKIGNYILPIVN